MGFSHPIGGSNSCGKKLWLDLLESRKKWKLSLQGLEKWNHWVRLRSGKSNPPVVISIPYIYISYDILLRQDYKMFPHYQYQHLKM